MPPARSMYLLFVCCSESALRASSGSQQRNKLSLRLGIRFATRSRRFFERIGARRAETNFPFRPDQTKQTDSDCDSDQIIGSNAVCRSFNSIVGARVSSRDERKIFELLIAVGGSNGARSLARSLTIINERLADRRPNKRPAQEASR